VIDARIGQQTPKIALDQHERGRQEDREDAEAYQQRSGEIMAKALLGQDVKAHDAVDGAIDKTGAQQRRRRDRRLGVSIGFPGVHRRQARLGAVAQQHQHERQPHRRRIEFIGDLH